MRAIILAAGESKRLRPLTGDQPKCLLTVEGRCILDHQISALKNARINEITIVTGYKADKIMGHVQTNYPDLDFDFIENKDFSNTNAAYSLWLAKHHLEDDVIYLNSDALFDEGIIHLVINDPHESVTALHKNAWNEEQVNIILDKKNRIIEIGKHISENNSHGEFVGITKLGKKFNISLVKALDHFVSQGELKKFAADAINGAIQNHGAEKYAVDIGNFKAIEIDTLEDYELAQRWWSNP